jgi:protein phosphatase
LRCAALEQLTRDHLLTQELLQNDHLTAEQAQASGNRNMLSRALGMAGGLEVDLAQHPAESGDLYLLCSDGLTGMIGDQELAALLNDPAADLRELAHQAVELAKRRGGRDNISIVLMRLA